MVLACGDRRVYLCLKALAEFKRAVKDIDFLVAGDLAYFLRGISPKVSSITLVVPDGKLRIFHTEARRHFHVIHEPRFERGKYISYRSSEYMISGLITKAVCDFAIRVKSGVFKYPLDNETTLTKAQRLNLFGEELYVIPLEDQLILSYLLGSVETVRRLVKRAFDVGTVLDVEYVRYKTSRLPKEIREDIISLVSILFKK